MTAISDVQLELPWVFEILDLTCEVLHTDQQNDSNMHHMSIPAWLLLQLLIASSNHSHCCTEASAIKTDRVENLPGFVF